MNRHFSAVVQTLILLSTTQLSYAGRVIPDDSFSRPVLLTLAAGGSGSGTYMTDDTYCYLVTARHVLYNEQGVLRSPSARLTSYPANVKDMGINIMDADLQTLQAESLIRVHPSVDVAVVRIAKCTPTGIEFHPAMHPQQRAEGPFTLSKTTDAVPFGDVLVGNEVYVFGYPSSLGMPQIPQLDPQRPLLRRGIVAGTNPKLETVIIDCPVYPGNSGGPVVQIDHTSLTETKFRMIGVVTEFVPFREEWVNATHRYMNIEMSNSGYSIVAPMDAVFELLWK